MFLNKKNIEKINVVIQQLAYYSIKALRSG